MRTIQKRIVTIMMVLLTMFVNIPISTERVEAATYTGIKLNVPYYPQKVSGDCGISSISMIEAYTLGYGESQYDAVYAGVLEANGGGLSISAATSGKYQEIGYDLSAIYNSLVNNKPVLIYRTSSDGSKNHWSVIIGYNGSSTSLSKSGFIVLNTNHGGRSEVNLETWLSGATWKHCEVRTTGCISSITENVTGFTLEHMYYPASKPQGSSYGVSGLLISGGTITNVELGVKNSSGRIVFSATATPNRKYYTLFELDPQMTFSKLSAGNYVYYLNATDSFGKTINWSRNITVGSSWNVQMDNVCIPYTSSIVQNSNKFSNIRVEYVTDTTAKICTEFTQGTYPDCGFYLGTSPSLSNMKKVSEGPTVTNAKYNSYRLGEIYTDTNNYKWWNPLTPGTKYYYAFYITSGSTTYVSAINSFTTTAH